MNFKTFLQLLWVCNFLSLSFPFQIIAQTWLPEEGIFPPNPSKTETPSGKPLGSDMGRPRTPTWDPQRTWGPKGFPRAWGFDPRKSRFDDL